MMSILVGGFALPSMVLASDGIEPAALLQSSGPRPEDFTNYDDFAKWASGIDPSHLCAVQGWSGSGVCQVQFLDDLTIPVDANIGSSAEVMETILARCTEECSGYYPALAGDVCNGVCQEALKNGDVSDEALCADIQDLVGMHWVHWCSSHDAATPALLQRAEKVSTPWRSTPSKWIAHTEVESTIMKKHKDPRNQEPRTGTRSGGKGGKGGKGGDSEPEPESES